MYDYNIMYFFSKHSVGVKFYFRLVYLSFILILFFFFNVRDFTSEPYWVFSTYHCGEDVYKLYKLYFVTKVFDGLELRISSSSENCCFTIRMRTLYIM